MRTSIDARRFPLLAADPGMRIGTPDIDGPACGNRKDPYPILPIRYNGSARVYQTCR